MSIQKNPKELADFNKLLEQEKVRTVIEKYSYKELAAGWLAIPVLFLIIGGIYLYVQSKATSQAGQTFSSIFIADVVVIFIISHYNKKWEKKLEAKKEIKNKDIADYNDGYIYTDSSFEKGIYLLAKIICYIVGIAGIGLLSLLAFSWLGSITIAPTTIIIILLGVMIYNQEKRANLSDEISSLSNKINDLNSNNYRNDFDDYYSEPPKKIVEKKDEYTIQESRDRALLGVKYNTSHEEIRKAYLEIRRQYNTQNANINAKNILEIDAAYKRLDKKS